jgi:hypothetical protein
MRSDGFAELRVGCATSKGVDPGPNSTGTRRVLLKRDRFYTANGPIEQKVHDLMSENRPGTTRATYPETDKSIIGDSLPSLARTLF